MATTKDPPALAVDSRYRGLPEGLPERIENLPQEPGVYIMKNRRGEVVYVGKAVNLRSRVKSYFSRGGDTRAFVSRLHRILGDLETILVRSEKEALLLEETLIKQHKPRYNVVYRDDKSFITLGINDNHPFPRIEVLRTHNISAEGQKQGWRYFGPYSSASAVRGTLRVLNQHFLLRTCTDHTLQNRSRPCLEYQIGRCEAPCVYDIPPDEYRTHVDDAVMFLQGKREALVTALKTRMEDAAGQMRFEEAAHLRDQIRDIQRTMEKQVVADSLGSDQDIFGLARRGNVVAITVLTVRGGKIVGKDTQTFPDAEVEDDEVLLQVLDAHYNHVAPGDVPADVLLPFELPEGEAAARASYLSEHRGKKVDVVVPQRGDKRRLMEIAEKNAQATLDELHLKEETRANALTRLQERLHLGRVPRVIECVDISLFQGAEPVASCVRFVDGKADKSGYRRFIVKTVTGTDDFAMMHEVITRRLKRGADGDDLPDLLVVDGGKGQLNAAAAAFKDLGIPMNAQQASQFHDEKNDDGSPKWPDRARWVELCSLAKARSLDEEKGYMGRESVVAEQGWQEGGDEGANRHSPERVFLPNVKDPIALKTNTAELHLMSALRDEAHRFAITFHRARRKKATFKSALDAIPGIGAARKKALLRHFGSLAAIKEASVDALKDAGVPLAVARRIYTGLREEASVTTESQATPHDEA